MSEQPYRLTGGTSPPPMFGRERLFTGLLGDLTKPTPDHVSVVGPPKYGKSVLLYHLHSHFREGSDPYLTSMYWDIRHGTPRSDAEFRSRLAHQVGDSLRPARPDLADYLDLDDEPWSALPDVLKEMWDEKQHRFLAILDGCDRVLDPRSRITRNFWDQMRALADLSGLRLVTGSRKRLLDLCYDEDSLTSDFWNIFADPIEVGCLSDDDWNGFLKPFADEAVRIDESGRKEIRNWTGGAPALAVALAGKLLADHRAGDLVSKEQVDETAEAMASGPAEIVRATWRDCSEELQTEVAQMARGSVRPSSVPAEVRDQLRRRGLAIEKRGDLRSSCRLMENYARNRRGDVAYLKRLFGDGDRYSSNIQELLDLRLDHFQHRADPRLAEEVRAAIRNLWPHPVTAVRLIRGIADTGLDLIWDAELTGNKALPVEWSALYDEGRTPKRFPSKRGAQCHLLRLLTGTENGPRIARFVTKPTFLLVDHLVSIGNFGQHLDGQDVSLPTAASFCLSAIELCERLAEELPR